MRYFIFLFLIFQFPATLETAEQGKEKDTGPKTVLALDPGPGNPRNSEGDFITLKNNRILFIYTHYSGGSGYDNDSAYLASRFSDDEGKSWSTRDAKVIGQEGKMNIMSVSLLRLKDGRIALFYLRKNSDQDCIPVVRFSCDEAENWSNPIPCITDRKGYFVLNNGRVIQLSDGRIIFAVALHQEPGEPVMNNTGRIFCYFSDDTGLTWKPGKEVSNPDKAVTQEPGLVELKTRTLMMFMRTESGVQYTATSTDNGETWSQAGKSSIISPLSPASIERIPSTNDLVMFWNNNAGENPAIKGKRTPFTVAISRDEGKTWEKIRNIEDDPDGWYCYTSIHFTKDAILAGHCAGSYSRGTGLSLTRITRIKYRWLYR